MLNFIQENWGIEEQPQKAANVTWSVGDRYLLKRMRDERSMENNLRLTETLREHGVPVFSIVPTLSGDAFALGEDGYYLLMEKLPGAHITDVFGRDSEAIAYETGVVTAKIHAALRAVQADLPHGEAFDSELRGWIHEGLKNSDLKSLQEAQQDIQALCTVYPELPKQFIHRDLHYGNLLFEGTTLTGVLDFDLGKWEARLFDLGYFLLGQLPGKDFSEIREPFLRFIRSYLQGYESVSALTDAEKQALPVMMCCIELLFVSFWLGEKQPKHVQDAYDIYYFVRENVQDIRRYTASL